MGAFRCSPDRRLSNSRGPAATRMLPQGCCLSRGVEGRPCPQMGNVQAPKQLPQVVFLPTYTCPSSATVHVLSPYALSWRLW